MNTDEECLTDAAQAMILRGASSSSDAVAVPEEAGTDRGESPGAEPSTFRSAVSVSIRLRPLLRNEVQGPQHAVKSDTELMIVREVRRMTSSGKSSETTSYNVNKIFSPASKQEDVYNFLIPSVHQAVHEGTNTSMLMYGQTGSGKTYTMSGVTPPVVHQAFELVGSLTDAFIELSVVQIYMNEVYNLLGSVAKEALVGKEVANRSHHRAKPTLKRVKGELLDWRPGSHIAYPKMQVETAAQTLSLLEKCEAARAKASHSLNSLSSRSHSIVVLHINHASSSSKIFLVDLAGSERVKKTFATGDAFEEGKAVNESLLALAKCMEALSKPDRFPVIPYRENVLTWVLQETFTNSLLHLICCCSMSQNCEDETRCTMAFADVAKTIQISRKVNESVKRAKAKREKLEADRAADRAEIEGEFKGTINAFRSENSRLSSDLYTLRDKLETQKKAHAEATARHRREVEALEKKLQGASKDHEQLCKAEKRALDLKEELDRVRAELKAREDQAALVEDLQDELAAAKQELRNSTAEVKRVSMYTEECESMAQRMLEERMEATAKAAELERRCSTSEQFIKELREKREQNQMTKLDMRLDPDTQLLSYHSVEENGTAAMPTDVSSLHKVVDELIRTLTDAEKEKGALVNAATAATDSAAAAWKECEIKTTALSDLTFKAQRELQEKSKECEDMAARCQQVEEEKEECERMLTKRTDEIHELSQLLSAMQSRNKRIAQLMERRETTIRQSISLAPMKRSLEKKAEEDD